MPKETHQVMAESGLNIRLEPGPESRDVGNLPYGAKVEVLEIPEGVSEDWAAIRLWVAGKYLEEISAGQEAPGEAEEGIFGQASPSAGDFDFSTKEGAIEAIKAKCRTQGLTMPEQIAYVLATVEWETARTFKPIHERGRDSYFDRYEGRRDLGNIYPGDGLKFKGRGFVQITGRANYTTFSRIIGQNLVDNPDLAINPEIALFILVHGFRTGAFTGKKITDYISPAGVDFYNARRCINGVDRADEIAALAEKYLESLS